MNEELEALIGLFLSERRESDGGYAPVEPEDWDQLHKIINCLINAKWMADPDGDRPINYRLVNRNYHQYDPFVTVVRYDQDTEAHERDTLINLDIALDVFKRYRNRQKWAKESMEAE